MRVSIVMFRVLLGVTGAVGRFVVYDSYGVLRRSHKKDPKRDP